MLQTPFKIAENTSAMLAYWDANLVCRFANAAYEQWFGVRPEDMIDKITLPQLLGPLFEKNLPYINQALAGKTQVFERDITAPNGELRHSIATYCPNFENGKPNGFYVHVADITALKNTTAPGHSPLSGSVMPRGVRSRMEAVAQTLQYYLFIGFPGITSIAKQHFTSETKLKREFKSHYHCTIFAYFRYLQMQAAEKYLKEKLYSKKQLASMLHFKNPSNFLTCYKKYLEGKAHKKQLETLEKEADDRYKTFVAQAPVALAMFDTNMLLLAASEQWIKDYQLQGRKINGSSIYELLPAINLQWQEIYAQTVKGNFSKSEQMIQAADGTTTWLRLDIKPWFTAKNTIGGITVFTENITNAKLEAEEKKRVFDILYKTSELTRIGTWERNLLNGEGIWSKVTRAILEVEPDLPADMTTGYSFYKTGASRQLIDQAIKLAVDKGQPFDVKVEMISAKGNTKQVRVIGFPDFINGRCERLYGIFQELSSA